MAGDGSITNVLVTGATGFVGRNVVRELLRRRLTPVCLVRSPRKLLQQNADVNPERFITVTGGLKDRRALQQAADLSQAAIHLVGIIIQRRLQGQTFAGIHVRGTHRVLEALQSAGVRRYVHMSALGAHEDAASAYHHSKWEAEQYVRQTDLAWTIVQPSIIHGPDGEFMHLLKSFVCDPLPPFIPYFGAGTARLQPVYVKDVAYCMVESLFRDETLGEVMPLGGPRRYSWIELYETCRRLIPGAKSWKPLVSQPVGVAKAIALASAPILSLAELMFSSLRKFRFDTGQVMMSQEDAVCDHRIAEEAFGMTMRDFETELAAYADRL